MGFPRQEYWSGLSYLPPEDLPDVGITPASFMSPAIAGGFFTVSNAWENITYTKPFQLCQHTKGTFLHAFSHDLM